MYVPRGQKRAERLVAALIESARDQGHRRITLGTMSRLVPHHIYRKAGVTSVDAPPGFPTQFRDRVIFMAIGIQG
ncbi:hypothetical protein ROLI_009260 [Roseobacter fucihabitans]|uniref:N-acetyltransferase domain-containing protein n=1 Tax=Roseobacter fucihabitans TaxID=1537242 RepID=A0ABZ2BPF0_9RHOB|nr:hypothetical protein [Roseobacter litoralis]MBC6966675.1 hypothetical protein [Roseobacter litoralis]